MLNRHRVMFCSAVPLVFASICFAAEPVPAAPAQTEPAQTEPAQAEPWQDALRYLAAGELDTAERLLLDAPADDAEALLLLGQVNLEQGRARDAVEAFERVIQLDPASSEAQLWLGDALVQRIDEVPFLIKLPIANRMRSAYEKAVTLDPENLEARVAVARYYAAAPPMAGGSTERAERELAEIRRRDVALAYVTQGLIHEHLEHFESAEAELRTAVEVDPESVLSWRELGYYLQRRERWPEAIETFEQVLVLAAEDPAALFETARSALIFSEQTLQRAERHLQTYLQLEPGPDPMLLGAATPPRGSVAHHTLQAIRHRLGKTPGIPMPREADTSRSCRSPDPTPIDGWTDCLLNVITGAGVR